ncbi:MAG: HD domain-containing protein, partial [Lachnospiraceae bacterium]|nr:HD domain-containing protein [Lachnospiraceae bacterium]
LLCAMGTVLNLAGSGIVQVLHIPLFLDSVGTILTAVLGGYLPGIVTGLVTNLVKGIGDSAAVYYGILNVLIAVCSAFLARKGYLKKPVRIVLFILALAVIGGGHGSVLTWFLYGFASEGISAPYAAHFYENISLGKFPAQFAADFLIDLADKTITVLLVLLVLKLLPQHIKARLRFDGWQQTPLSEEGKAEAKHSACRVMSLRTKILLLLTIASLSIAVAATTISVMLFRNSTIKEHIKLGQGIANLASSVIEPQRVDEYLELGEQAEGYPETEDMLYRVKESSPDIEYVYVYKIMEDGCHVVFDLDTEEVEGSKPGEVIPFDEAFYPYLPALLAGETIEPIISNESFGWLLTVYQPVYDEDGVCVCYAAADISMHQLAANEYSFFVRLLSLFLGFFILILAVGLWFAEYNIILPVNTMALSASAFAYDSEEARTGSIERIRELEICTGDEVENLYQAFLKTTEDSMQYVADIQSKTETISRMQSGLIMVLADIVESRDKCTGDHVRRTAAYTKIIMEEMQKRGFYAEELTDDFISDVVNSAPLHDIGKIQVRDAVLNKPGKLTEDEFREMKNHTTAGSEIISRAIATVPDSGYLAEAKNLAEYHHEKWNGTGYPNGLAGEEIPLSARIMAVADVFDALVSKRSYKKPFSFEDAMDIIRDGAGTHFDPKVAEAFLAAEDAVRKVAEEFGESDEELR